MGKLSVIVPIYNVGKVLRNTLDSIISQTLTDIEIICVDDCSDDCCREILNEYASKDSRIKLIYHQKNRGLLRTRKSGVEASSGKYIMFVDGDDELTPDACQVAYTAIEKEQTDFLAFGTQVVNCVAMPEKMIKKFEKKTELLEKKIECENLLMTWWHDRFCNVHVWNKIYKSEICKKAYDMTEDGYFLDAEDWYFFIMVLCLAKSYTAIGKKLYRYNWGLGTTGGDKYTLKKYDGRLTEKYVVDALYRFADAQQNTEELKEIVKEIEKHFLKNCINLWKNLLLPEFCSEGFKHLIKMWGAQNVLCQMAENEWESSVKLSGLLSEVEYLKRADRRNSDTLVIAMYVPFDINSKAREEVLRFASAQVIFVTDGITAEQKCEVDSFKNIFTLPNYKESKKENYRPRFLAWEELISKHQVDIVVAWGTDSNIVFWDMLAVKSHETKPAYVICNREFCCTPYRMSGNNARKWMSVYDLCDGVVVSSECDEKYVSAFANHVKCIPVLPEMCTIPHDNRYDSHIIIWDDELLAVKHPLDMIHAMQMVLLEIPDAELYIIGEGSENIKDQLLELIHRFDLNEHVYFAHEEEKASLYKMASIYVCTAEIENAWNSIGEAMLWKLPVVSYELPWLSLFKDGRGIQKVKQGRWDLLAKGIIDVLGNEKTAAHLGNAGHQNVLDYINRDVRSEWSSFFNQIFEIQKENSQISDEQIVYRYLTSFQDIGRRSAVGKVRKNLDQEKKINLDNSNKINELNFKIKKLEKKISSIENSTTFKVGKMIMFLPIKIKLLLKKL